MRKELLFIIFLALISAGFCADSIIIGVRVSSTGDYLGVVADLNVQVKAGSGNVYIDTTPLTEIDTQASARLAKEVACEMIGSDCSDKDFFYTIRGEFPMIGGPSAGAAMTVLTMCELSGYTTDKSVAMTGTVNPDGSIGSIGGLPEKALAAQEEGIKTFLVPLGQLRELENTTLSMNVVEVGTVRDAFGYFTGIFFSELDDEINFNEFNEFMKPMSEDLMNYSDDLYDELLIAYDNANLSYDNALIIQSLIDSVELQRNNTLGLFLNNSYYSAASYAVNSGILTLYTYYLVNYFETGTNEYVHNLLSFANNEINSFGVKINNPFILNHINDLESVNIAVDRYFEARELYNAAVDYYNESDIPDALYNLAFMYVRLETSNTWLDLKDSFNDNLSIEFSQDLLKDLALARIETAGDMITYAESVESSYYTDNAWDLLGISEEAYNGGNYIYSIFESLRSLANANLAMQLRGVTEEVVDERIELSDKLARENINLVQSNGLIPIIAISYYEYSQTFKESDPATALLFLEYSKQFALLSSQMVNSMGFGDLTFGMASQKEVGVQLLALLLGVVLGIGLVFSLLLRSLL